MSVPYVGAKISLISKSRIRYEGILFTIDADKSQVTLRNVRSFGTEDRRPEAPIGPSNEVWECIIFRGTDIQDLHVCEPPPASPQPVPSQDPAIVSMPPMGGFPGYGVPPNFSGYYGGYPYNPYGGYPYGPYQAGPMGGQPAGQAPAPAAGGAGAGAGATPAPAGRQAATGSPAATTTTTTPATTAPAKTAEATVPALGVYPSTQQQGVSPLAQLSQTPATTPSIITPATATPPASVVAAAPALTPAAPASTAAAPTRSAPVATTTPTTPTKSAPAAGSTTSHAPKPAPTAGTRPASFASAAGARGGERDRRAFPTTASAGPGARDIMQPFDFDASNALWDKEKDIVLPAEPVEPARPAYVKSSFFDAISCETTDRAANPGARAPSLYEQRVLDSETFGSTAVQDRERTQRRGGRGGRGGRGRGRGPRPSNGYAPREHSAARGPADS